MVIYLSGPMSGIEDFNYPAFCTAAEKLRGQGHEVINPAEAHNGDTSKSWEYYVRRDIQLLVHNVDAVAVLPGWETSRGASLEVFIAQQLKFPIFDKELKKQIDTRLNLLISAANKYDTTNKEIRIAKSD